MIQSHSTDHSLPSRELTGYFFPIVADFTGLLQSGFGGFGFFPFSFDAASPKIKEINEILSLHSADTPPEFLQHPGGPGEARGGKGRQSFACKILIARPWLAQGRTDELFRR